MSKLKPHVQEEIAPNLIPMIDIMFLLLLFFMLGADMGHRELEDVRLPQAGSVMPDDRRDPTKLDRMTINVAHDLKIKCPVYENKAVCRDEDHWRFVIGGETLTREELRQKLAETANLDREPGKPTSNRKVMIRADEGAPYGMAQRAMNECAATGMYKIEVGAKVPPKEKQ